MAKVLKLTLNDSEHCFNESIIYIPIKGQLLFEFSVELIFLIINFSINSIVLYLFYRMV
jgi:hypothetical protein